MGIPLAPRGKVLLLAGLFFALLGAACASQEPVVDSLEQRAQTLDKALVCPICPGESIDQSQVELARQMRAVVREKLAEGWTKEQVKEFFVERYGPSVLMEPPQEGFYLLAWVLPPVGVATAVVVLYLVLRHLLRAEPRARPEGLEELPAEERQEYLRQVEAALEEELGPSDRRL